MDQANKQGQGGGFFNRFLTIVERLGNGLPHPVTMFALFALATILLSGLGGWLDWQVADPRPVGAPGRAEDGMIRITSLLSGDGFRRIIENLVKNFVEFAPLGTVLVALLGVGIAEHSGLFSAAIRAVILGAPKTLVTAVLVFAGVMSNAASEVGYVVLVPLGAAIFYSLGRHPLAGLAAAFAGVSGGYSANLLIGTVDPLLAGITQEAARIFDPRYEVHPAVNWYFMAASVPVVTVLGTWVTARIVEPRLGKFDLQSASNELDSSIVMQPLEPLERKGLFWSSLSAALLCLGLVYLAGPIFGTSTELFKDPAQKGKGPSWQQVCGWTEAELNQQLQLTESAREMNRAAGEQLLAEAKASEKDLKTVKLPAFPTTTYAIPAKSGWQGEWNARLLGLPGYGMLRDPGTGDLLRSPLLKGVVAIIFVFFLIPGYVYGYVVGKLRSDKDLINAMSKTMGTMGLYIVLTFFAAQFVKFFEWSNLGTMLAVVGAEGIRAIGLDNPLVFIPFILLCATINLLMGSASAKWAVTAPIFVPMLMLVGYSPELIQNAYRIGDSVTNVITPMMSYFGMIYAFAAKYQKDLGMGTLISLMLPYSLIFLIGWTAFFYLWVFLLDFPIGPGAPLTYPPGP